jgi:molybdate transport system ATP-binding protein
MTLAAKIELARGDFAVRAELAVAGGEVLALVGPNGAGKTTLLRALAGLDAVDAGEIRLDERVLDAPAAGVFVPPEARDVGYAFQDQRLFPHLGALDNIAFGLRARGVARDEARRRAARWLEHVGATELAAQRPAGFSGGEGQRVALARALATEPRLLLLDEPLAAIDAASRIVLRRLLLERLRLRTGPSLVVTHDPVEAAVLGRRIVVLDGGAVVDAGTPAEIAAAPRSAYAAAHVGLNVFRGRAAGHWLDVGSGGTLFLATSNRGEVTAVVHPHAVSLHAVRPEGSPRNTWAATVAALVPVGECVRVRLDAHIPIVAEVTERAVAELHLTRGRPLWVSLKATEIAVVPG